MENKEFENCWEFIKCAEEIRKACPAYKYDMGKECWMIASSFNGKGCPQTKDKGMIFCATKCKWFEKLHPHFLQ